MRLRHIKGAEEQIAESPYVIQDPQGLKGKWHEFFGNQNP
ncbi:tRNA (guanosine(46)-N7)-methyltransferase TrmB, partial [Alitiscatomonas aceti]|nr:tRNA (guanosine(46)-N7)-methyltransferase TrmB [Alitiscatomonas aceti]